MENRAFKPAFELVREIKSKKIRSRDLLELYIQRIEAHNPPINAVVATDYEAARKRAEAADWAVDKKEDWGLLHGLPMTIKDNLAVAGMPCTAGAPALKSHIPDRNADVVQYLLDQGAVIFGKTNMPRYGEDVQTFNGVHGQTNNPWNTAKTPGGSSGGAAAALSAGLTGLEIGNDFAGSIRIPAHFCGIYGHKPTYGIVPDRGMIPPLPGIFTGDHTMPTDILVSGPMARSAQDLDLAMDIITAPEIVDRKAWQIRLPAPRKTALADYRIGLWLDDPACPVDSAVGDRLQQAADALAKAGATVSQKRPDIEFTAAFEVFSDLVNGVMGLGIPQDMFKAWTRETPEQFESHKASKQRFIRGAIQRHTHWLLRDAERQMMRQKWDDFFADFDALLCPVAPVAAFAHDQGPFHDRTIEVNGGQHPYSSLMAWAGLTNTAYLPATVAPVGMTPEGLPVGAQIVGPFLEDKTPIHIAALMADVVGGYRSPGGYTGG